MKPIDFLPLTFAILCYLLAFLTKSSPAVSTGLVALGGTLTGLALPQLSATLAKRAKEIGAAVLLVGVGLLASPSAAHADWQPVSPGVYKSGAWVAHPNFALSAGQINVKEALTNGVLDARSIERIALAGGYGLTYHGEQYTIGAGLYFGTGISAKTPNAPQVDLLFTFWDALATGPGVQRVTFPSGSVAYQMLWTIGLNYAAGGTVSRVAPWFDKVLSVCTSAACGL